MVAVQGLLAINLPRASGLALNTRARLEVLVDLDVVGRAQEVALGAAQVQALDLVVDLETLGDNAEDADQLAKMARAEVSDVLADGEGVDGNAKFGLLALDHGPVSSEFLGCLLQKGLVQQRQDMLRVVRDPERELGAPLLEVTEADVQVQLILLGHLSEHVRVARLSGILQLVLQEEHAEAPLDLCLQTRLDLLVLRDHFLQLFMGEVVVGLGDFLLIILVLSSL
mmetsp:Transcript_67482/g.141035  ORF Transcript_67482/g.141035 Transcript_67482/m.141035 type:complete len:226 (-) Transcript_67482:511-1188(-)